MNSSWDLSGDEELTKVRSQLRWLLRRRGSVGGSWGVVTVVLLGEDCARVGLWAEVRGSVNDGWVLQSWVEVDEDGVCKMKRKAEAEEVVQLELRCCCWWSRARRWERRWKETVEQGNEGMLVGIFWRYEGGARWVFIYGCVCDFSSGEGDSAVDEWRWREVRVYRGDSERYYVREWGDGKWVVLGGNDERVTCSMRERGQRKKWVGIKWVWEVVREESLLCERGKSDACHTVIGSPKFIKFVPSYPFLFQIERDMRNFYFCF